MLIAIDASRAINEKAGIGRITLELVRKLIEIDKKNKYLLLFSYVRKNSEKEKIINSFKYENVVIKTWRIPGQLKERVWGWKIPWFGKLLKQVDIFYAPSFFEVNLGLKIPQVVTIYDMTTFLFPEHRGEKVSKKLNLRTKEACRLAQKVIAISESTKTDLIKTLKIPEKKIKVIYPGKEKFPKVSKRLPASIKPKSYILAVGTIEPRKNLIGLFKAYALLPLKIREKYPLVIVGAKGWNTGETFNTLKALQLEDQIKFLGFLKDDVLARLYKDASVFIYPSLYEGFGLPVVEAMSFNTPVITSNLSSMPEAAGKAALLVDPNDPTSIANGLQRLLEHSELADELGKKGIIQAKKFTWEKAALQTLKVFEEIVQ